METKNNFKKLNILNIVLSFIKKTNHVKKSSDGRQIVKMVLKEIESNDNLVREKACEIIAKMKDSFNQKVQPLLSDLNS